MSEWIETTIGEQATLQRGIDITKAEQRVGSVPVISSSGVSSYHDTAAIAGPGALAGLERPDIGILSDAFLEEVRQLPQRNFAVELLQKLLNDEIKSRARTKKEMRKSQQCHTFQVKIKNRAKMPTPAAPHPYSSPPVRAEGSAG